MTKSMAEVIKETGELFDQHVKTHRSDYSISGLHTSEERVVSLQNLLMDGFGIQGVARMHEYAQNVLDENTDETPAAVLNRKLVIELWQRLQSAVKTEGLKELPDLIVTRSAADAANAAKMFEQKVLDAKRMRTEGYRE